MKNQELEIIKDWFERVQSVRQLADLLNKVEDLIYKNKTTRKKITSRDLNYLSMSKDRRYKECFIPKKNGNQRKINTPDNYLKRVQTLLNRLLQIIFEDYANHNSNGFLDGRNILRNAKPHTNKKYVLNIDIEDFFPSIEFRRIKSVLELNPFNLKEQKERIAFVIANIVTYNNCLPQGAPTSPIISNIVTQRLDRKLTKLAITNRIRYSRYADDITFSTNKDIFNEDFIKKIATIIEEEKFKINSNKTRIRTSMNRQEVTGLIVNQKVNVKRKYLQSVRAMLNNWEKKGIEFAQKKYDYHKKKVDQNIDFRNSLRGHIDFIGSIKGKDNPVYSKLKLRYEYLYNRLNYEMIKNENVRRQLIKDNKKMELILLDNIHSPNDKFISFCTSAFHQIENLLNYYYWKRFPNIESMKQFMLDNNPAFKKKWKTLDKLKWIKKISDFNIHLLVYLYEKEHYFDKGIYYNKEITLLREIRNDESHRCSIFELDKQKIYSDYEKIKEKWKIFKKNKNRYPEKQKNELEIEFKVKLFEFLDQKNYNKVRETLKNVIIKTTETNAM
ncbi:MAG: hypothetical protein Kow0027_08770 [Saprospiraceae bacterium]